MLYRQVEIDKLRIIDESFRLIHKANGDINSDIPLRNVT